MSNINDNENISSLVLIYTKDDNGNKVIIT